MTREQKRARRTEVLQDAAPIWQASDRSEVERRRRAFVDQWALREPRVVALLERVFGHTVAYLEALGRGREWGEVWDVRCLRTTSALERANRCWRQKARQAGAFHSDAGLQAAFVLVTLHHHLTLAPVDEPWTEVLEQALAAA